MVWFSYVNSLLQHQSGRQLFDLNSPLIESLVDGQAERVVMQKRKMDTFVTHTLENRPKQ